MRALSFDPGDHPLFFDEPTNEAAFFALFGSDALCEAHILRVRFPTGFRCPRCSARAYRILPRHVLVCRSCRRKTWLLSGTIFERTKVPLTKWFFAAFLLRKPTMNATLLAKVLGVAYRTAWLLAHKLRSALAPILKNTQGPRPPLHPVLARPGLPAPAPSSAAVPPTSAPLAPAIPASVLAAVLPPPPPARPTPRERALAGNLPVLATGCSLVVRLRPFRPREVPRAQGSDRLERPDLSERLDATRPWDRWIRERGPRPSESLFSEEVRILLAPQYRWSFAERYLGAYLDEFAYRFNRRWDGLWAFFADLARQLPLARRAPRGTLGRPPRARRIRPWLAIRGIPRFV